MAEDIHPTRDPADATNDLLIEYECLYRETGNPYFAWEAFLEFCSPDKPLPAWIRDYLRGCAASWLTEDQPAWQWPEPPVGYSSKPGHLGLLDLFYAVRDRKMRPDDATRAVPRAFGLTGKNGNAFAANRDLEHQAAVVEHYERFKRKGTSEADLLVIAKKLGKSPGTLKRWIPKWRRLWELQRKAKDAFAGRGK